MVKKNAFSHLGYSINMYYLCLHIHIPEIVMHPIQGSDIQVIFIKIHI